MNSIKPSLWAKMKVELNHMILLRKVALSKIDVELAGKRGCEPKE